MEYKVDVSRSESRSRSPETQEPPHGKKAPAVPGFKTPEKKDTARFEKEENLQRDTSAQKKTRASVFVPSMTPEKTEVASGKKTAQVKRHSIAVPMKHVVGK